MIKDQLANVLRQNPTNIAYLVLAQESADIIQKLQSEWGNSQYDLSNTTFYDHLPEAKPLLWGRLICIIADQPQNGLVAQLFAQGARGVEFTLIDSDRP